MKKDKVSLKEVERLAQFGLIDKEIAYILGVCKQTLNNWKKDEKFKAALAKGKLVADNKVIKSLYEKALGYTKGERYYPADTTAIIFWLKNRRPDLWRDKRELEHSGEVKFTKEEKNVRYNRIRDHFQN